MWSFNSIYAIASGTQYPIYDLPLLLIMTIIELISIHVLSLSPLSFRWHFDAT